MFTAQTKCLFFKLPNFEQWCFIHLDLNRSLYRTCIEVQNFEQCSPFLRGLFIVAVLIVSESFNFISSFIWTLTFLFFFLKTQLWTYSKLPKTTVLILFTTTTFLLTITTFQIFIVLCAYRPFQEHKEGGGGGDWRGWKVGRIHIAFLNLPITNIHNYFPLE